MKKIIAILTCGFLLSSCAYDGDPAVQGTAIPVNIVTPTGTQMDVFEYPYDGCIYVRFGSSESSFGAHKGNCKNPIHKQNGSQEQKRETIVYDACKYYKDGGAFVHDENCTNAKHITEPPKSDTTQ